MTRIFYAASLTDVNLNLLSVLYNIPSAVILLNLLQKNLQHG